MTIHHDIALVLAVLLVIAGLLALMFGPQLSHDNIKDIIGFATIIATNTFAHAQGVRSGAAAAKKAEQQHHENGDGR